MSPEGASASAEDERSRWAAVEARVRDYHSAGLTEVLEAIEYLRDGEDSVIAGGSLTLGLGNGLSDLDIVITGSQSKESSRVPLQHWIGTLRVDVWKLRFDAMYELVGRAESALEGAGPIDGAFGDSFEEADLKLLHRLAFGFLVDGPPLTPLTPPSSRSHREIAGDLLVREYAERMRETLFVAQLAHGAGRTDAAALNARTALNTALHAAVYARGLPFTGDKWLRERLDADAPRLASVHEDFAVLPDAAHAGDYVARVAQFCADASGLDVGLEALAAGARFGTGDLRLFRPPGARYLVSAARDILLELDEIEADAWERREPGAWPAGDLDAGQLTLAGGLYANGAVALEWAGGLPVDQLRFGDVALA